MWTSTKARIILHHKSSEILVGNGIQTRIPHKQPSEFDWTCTIEFLMRWTCKTKEFWSICYLSTLHGICKSTRNELKFFTRFARNYLFTISLMEYVQMSTLQGISKSTKMLNICYLSTLSDVHLVRNSMVVQNNLCLGSSLNPVTFCWSKLILNCTTNPLNPWWTSSIGSARR